MRPSKNIKNEKSDDKILVYSSITDKKEMHIFPQPRFAYTYTYLYRPTLFAFPNILS